jgi:hypothetical protein
MSAIEITKDVATKIYAGKTKLQKLTLTAITPYLNISDTYSSMEEFLVRSHSNDETTGMVIDYSGGETRFHLLTESGNTSSMRSEFQTQHSNYAEFDDEYTVENHQFELGEYMSTAEFYLSEDYWYPLIDHNNATGNAAVSDDVLASIIHEISKNRRSDENVRLQIICEPVDDTSWKVRRPIQNYLLAALRPFKAVKNASYYAYEFGKSIADGRSNKMKEAFSNCILEIKDGISDTIDYLQGYTYMDKQDDIDDKIRNLEYQKNNSDSWGASNEKYLQNLKESSSRMESKASREGFIVEMRLMVTGEDKEGVNNKMDRITREIERKLSVKGGVEALNQSIDSEVGSSYTDIVNIGLDLFYRNRGVDFHRRIEDSERFPWLKRSRSKPTILTPPEIATFMHVPDSTVEDRSIDRKEQE